MDIKKRANFVLDSELSAYTQNGRTGGGLGTFNVGLQSVPNLGWTQVGSVTQYLFDEVDKNFIQSENSTLLLKLYSSLDNSNRKELENHLLAVVDRESSHKDVTYLICFVFIRLGKTKVVIEKAKKDLVGDSKHAYSNLLHMFKLILAREYTYFHFDDLSEISDLLNDDTEAQHALIPTLREACKRVIAQDIDNLENPEVSNDMKNVITFFNTNFPESEIPNQIKHIEDLFEQGNFDSQSYATAVDRVRILLVSVTKFLAIQKGLNNPATKDDKSFGKYLYDNKHITPEEYDLLKSFYTLCSNNGAHITKTEVNTARLVKNMGIEIVSLLTSYLK